MSSERRTLGLYIHVPFCIRKCAYCDFLSVPDLTLADAYLSALLAEMRGTPDPVRAIPVDSIYIPGGTPSVLPKSAVREILKTAGEVFSVMPGAEITMEMNPGAADGYPEDAGITRLSIGLQSLDDRLLHTLGRIHTREEAVRTIGKMRRTVGNLSVDLMMGLPGQTPEDLAETIEGAAALGPDHISCYSLSIEEGTPFYRLYDPACGTEREELPDEETEREMYHAAVRQLAELGYQRYEISNFAKPGFESRHNLRYWRREDYLGFGPGAASFVSETRWENEADVAGYCTHGAVKIGIVHLDRDAQMEETMFLGLRLTEGVSDRRFRETFGTGLMEEYGGVIRRHVSEGLLRFRDGILTLTDRGIDISNTVLADFLKD